MKYVQIREYVRELVQDLPPGSPAPSERALMAEFGVARMTVRQAINSLVVEGLLERRAGRGSFVAHPRRQVGRLSGFTEEMERRGQRVETKMLHERLGQAGPGVARALGITEGDSVIHWKRLRIVDGAPMAVEDAYLNEVLLPGFAKAGAPPSLYAALSVRGLRPTWAEDAVSAELPSPEEASLLGITAADPVLRQMRRALSGDAVLVVSRTCYRGDAFTMRVQLGQEG